MRLYFGKEESLGLGNLSDTTTIVLGQFESTKPSEIGSTDQSDFKGAIGLMNGILFGIYFWVITITIALLVF
jgi:hypothetical protein